MTCVECGKPGKLYNNLCEKCYLKKTQFFSLPKVLKINLCSNCYAWEKSKHWETSTSDKDSFNQLIRDNLENLQKVRDIVISTDFKEYKTNILIALVHVTGVVQDLDMELDLKTEIRITYGTCSRCSKLLGNYFEAKIQVRGTNRKLDESELLKSERIVDDILQQSEGTETNAFLTKSELIHGGEDFYIGSSTAARQIAKRLIKEFSGKLKESSKLIGRRDGRDIFRTTFTIRIPEYRPSDFIKLNGQIYQVLKIMRKNVTVVKLITGLIQHFSHDELSQSKLIGGKELVFSAVLVLEKAKEVEVLDPDNYLTLELVKPKNFKVDGETVQIFKDQENVFLIPNNINK
ncbi:MAG: 60S ribosomal export protein NMD3 [Candidatus Thorarchaeota archaeon]